ncbi:hypothetical protein TNCV_846051 [Trichonephila clavipes]|nr:hypothetical protein TNCV_846051 [Trichonephila clavipes]
MPPVSCSQIEAHEIHRGKGLEVRLAQDFGPTDLTSTYSVSTRKVFGGIELSPPGLESDALTTRLSTALLKKLEESLKIRPGQGRKSASKEVITGVTTTTIDGSKETIASSRKTRNVSRSLGKDSFKVRRALRRLLFYYRYKISYLHQLNHSV